MKIKIYRMESLPPSFYIRRPTVSQVTPDQAYAHAQRDLLHKHVIEDLSRGISILLRENLMINETFMRGDSEYCQEPIAPPYSVKTTATLTSLVVADAMIVDLVVALKASQRLLATLKTMRSPHGIDAARQMASNELLYKKIRSGPEAYLAQYPNYRTVEI